MITWQQQQFYQCLALLMTPTSLCVQKNSRIRIPCPPGLQSNTSLEYALKLVLILLLKGTACSCSHLKKTKALTSELNSFLIEFHCIPSNPLSQICFQFLIMMEFRLYLQEKGLMQIKAKFLVIAAAFQYLHWMHQFTKFLGVTHDNSFQNQVLEKF